MALTINTMLDTIKDDMEATIIGYGGYNTEPRVIHGLINDVELDGYFPAISFGMVQEELKSAFSDTDLNGYVRLFIQGFTKFNSDLDKHAIRKLAHDTLYYFLADCDYHVLRYSEINYFDGVEETPISMFSFTVDIEYSTTLANLRS